MSSADTLLRVTQPTWHGQNNFQSNVVSAGNVGRLATKQEHHKE